MKSPLAKARDKWFESEDTTAGQYLQNRLERAFLAGAKFSDERIKNLDERIEALERLLVCYRVRKNPSEALHRKLEKTKQALEGGR